MEAAGTEQIWEVAVEAGLDPFPTHFEVIPVHIMYQLGAYGVPGRYSHWTHGRAYHLLKTRYDHGLQRIYELVINADPCQAYLLDRNTELENKLITAHVLAHSDFFKNNIHFQHTDRRMPDTALVHAERLRSYELEHGRNEVERFLDACIALQEHSGPHAGREVYHPRKREHITAYDDLWKLGKQTASVFADTPDHRQNRCPERDLLYFLMHNSPRLENWQRDAMNIVRTEWLYLRPQLLTRITNEGWASYWHRELMRTLELSAAEYLRFAALHAQITAPSEFRLNPYHLGLKLWEHIEELEGRQGMFEARELESDVSILRNYLDEQLVRELKLFTYQLQGTRWTVTESAADDWEAVRDQLVQHLAAHGLPDIKVVDDDYRGNGELYLRHDYSGIELDQHYAEKTMQHLHNIWKRPVYLETVFGDKLTEICCRGCGEIQVENKGRYGS